MIDMKFPLDIIWFDANCRAVFIEANLSLCTPEKCPVITPNVKAMYVLEVSAGLVQAYRITYGTDFVFLNV
jgi:uncharacterized membrane protein (UPF0127 family)